MSDSDDPTLETELSDDQNTGEAVPQQDSQQGTEGETKGTAGNLEKRFHDTQAALTKSNQEKAEMARKFDELSGKFDAVMQMVGQGKQQQQSQEPSPLAFLDDKDFKEKLFDDPENVVKAIKSAVGYIADTLEMRDRAILGEIDRRDPTVREVAEKIAELRKDEDYAQLDNNALRIIAKKQLKTPAKEVSNEGDNFRGSVGGRRVSAPKSDDATEREINRWMEKIGYDREQ